MIDKQYLEKAPTSAFFSRKGSLLSKQQGEDIIRSPLLYSFDVVNIDVQYIDVRIGELYSPLSTQILSPPGAGW